MNQTQRKFLIDKITKNVEASVNSLKSSIPESPSLSNYLLHAVLSGTFEIKSNEEIKEVIRQKAVKSKDRDDWLGNSWHRATSTDVVFNIKDIFIIPEMAQKLYDQYKTEKARIELEVKNLRIQSDSLITRIQLASDKTLQTMINEVDDMGNISLMDTKLKSLSGGIDKFIE